MLSPSEDYTGGSFEIKTGGKCGAEEALELVLGDVVVWQSWRTHRVAPLLQGSREVLVVELWEFAPNKHSFTGRPDTPIFSNDSFVAQQRTQYIEKPLFGLPSARRRSTVPVYLRKSEEQLMKNIQSVMR